MRNETKNMVLTGLFIGLGIIMPQIFHAFGLGYTFLPMHFPVLICGIVLGWKYGLVTGFTTPLLVSVLSGVPPFPMSGAMALEMAAYGLVTGILFHHVRLWKSELARIYFALIGAMLAGRIIYGAANVIILGLKGSSYAFSLFITDAFITTFPGIILQILLIPPFVYFLRHYHNLLEK